MNLGKNVYNLLKRQPEVYVAGLGSFRRNHTPATYDEKRNVYLPPITYIDFDRTGSQGYDFIQYIQQLQLIDRGEAEDEVAAQVADLLRRAKEDGQVKLDDLGHLVRYGESYVFKALDLSGFQYTPVEAIAGAPQPIKEVAPEPESVEQEEQENALTEEATISEEVPPAETAAQPEAIPVEDPIEVEEEEEVSRSGSNALWYAIIVVVALGIMVALYVANRNQQTTSSPRTASAAVDSNVNPQDTTPPSLAGGTGKPDTLKEAAVDTSMTQANKPLVPEHHTWQVVIGSHRTLAQAYEQAESYNKAGYPQVRVIPSVLARNRKKVIWDSYATKQEADSALKYVQRHHIRDAWPDQIKE